MSKKSDKYYIKKCLKLAKLGRGYVSPNPLVGAIIVDYGKIIAEAYHQKFGEGHAERNAVNMLPEDYDFSNSTIYINLEPCTHFGKTPPCCDILIEKKFKKVVFAMKDPNPKVAGESINKLKDNNIDYKFGVLDKKAKYMNRFFIKHIQSQKPYIIVKVAQTVNGKIASFNNESKWISCEKSRKDVHKLRSAVDVVLVGTGTIKNDSPQLDVRLTKGRNPLRILVTRDLDIEKTKLYNDINKERTILVCSNLLENEAILNELSKDVRIIQVSEEDGKLNLEELFTILGKEGINSILVESGSSLS